MEDGHLSSTQQERSLSEALKERRATSSFDGSPIPDQILASILEAGMAAPSGYNLQPWRFIVVRSPEQKKRLREAAMNQPKVEQASAVVVFCGDLDAKGEKNLDAVLTESEKYGFSREQNQIVKKSVTQVFSGPAGNAMGLSPDYAVWVNRHVMIAFTTMMWRAETLGYDTAPMEGFFEDKVKALLDIPENVRVVALLAIGKRKGQDKPYGGRHKIDTICFDEAWGKQCSLK
ncbi:MAG: nitroreductase family protein [Legionella sp.]|nr:nitroreductase family protein [Legionella sp.]